MGLAAAWSGRKGRRCGMRKGYVILERIRSREYKWDHASAGLQRLLQGRFPVIALVREITLFPGCRPGPSSLPARKSSPSRAEPPCSLFVLQ